MEKHKIPVLDPVNPPSKAELLHLLTVAVNDGLTVRKPFVVAHRLGLKNLLELMQSKPYLMADSKWLTLIMAKVAGPDHPMFQYDYEPPKREKTGPKPIIYNNDDGFWDKAPKVSHPSEFTLGLLLYYQRAFLGEKK